MSLPCDYPGCSYVPKSSVAKQPIHRVPFELKNTIAQLLGISTSWRPINFCRSHFRADAFRVGKDERVLLRKDVAFQELLKMPDAPVSAQSQPQSSSSQSEQSRARVRRRRMSLGTVRSATTSPSDAIDLSNVESPQVLASRSVAQVCATLPRHKRTRKSLAANAFQKADEILAELLESDQTPSSSNATISAPKVAKQLSVTFSLPEEHDDQPTTPLRMPATPARIDLDETIATEAAEEPVSNQASNENQAQVVEEPVQVQESAQEASEPLPQPDQTEQFPQRLDSSEVPITVILHSAQAKIELLEAELQSVKKDNLDYQIRHDHIAKALHEKISELHGAKKENIDCQTHHDQVVKELSEKIVELQHSTQKVSELEKQLAANNDDELQSLKAEKAITEATLARCRAELSASQTKIASLQLALDDAQERVVQSQAMFQFQESRANRAKAFNTAYMAMRQQLISLLEGPGWLPEQEADGEMLDQTGEEIKRSQAKKRRTTTFVVNNNSEESSESCLSA